MHESDIFCTKSRREEKRAYAATVLKMLDCFAFSMLNYVNILAHIVKTHTSCYDGNPVFISVSLTVHYLLSLVFFLHVCTYLRGLFHFFKQDESPW